MFVRIVTRRWRGTRKVEKKPKGRQEDGDCSLRVREVMRGELHGMLHRLLRGVQHGLNAGYPLRRVAYWIRRIMMRLRPCSQARMILGFFFEVRNAYSTVIVVVVATIVLLLMRGPIGLCKILQTLLHTLR